MCSNLASVTYISKRNTFKVIDMSYMFCYYKSFMTEKCFSDISKWNTSNVKKNKLYVWLY